MSGVSTSLSVAYGTGAGTSPAAANIQADTRDDSGLIWLATGTGSPASNGATVATINLGANYSSGVDEPAVPKVAWSLILGGLSVANATAVLAANLVVSVTQNTIVIKVGHATNALPTSLPATSSGLGFTWQIDS